MGEDADLPEVNIRTTVALVIAFPVFSSKYDKEYVDDNVGVIVGSDVQQREIVLPIKRVMFLIQTKFSITDGKKIDV